MINLYDGMSLYCVGGEEDSVKRQIPPFENAQNTQYARTTETYYGYRYLGVDSKNHQGLLLKSFVTLCCAGKAKRAIIALMSLYTGVVRNRHLSLSSATAAVTAAEVDDMWQDIESVLLDESGAPESRAQMYFCNSEANSLTYTKSTPHSK
ncbi:hypothetical protein CEXT_157321 [Caerostris extrusa]|uniref:Uncharacterized protein n=1 Tax=Caerostris extrusa TaxID=172846 RepID=A0AAV4NFZ4_CAEEX|nr:hypothetical protein CEXT_157321 [Caerostris extrusa]